ncbi:MAG: DUF2842 domain-containing protein [Fimbriimonadaceae bacterium]|nr:DUF2842 domain-containing protein [Alphaproteobacteria bacterium]
MRNLIGLVALLLFIPLYILAIMWLAAKYVDGSNIFVQTVFYLVAGVIWTWPAMQIITWIKKPR